MRENSICHALTMLETYTLSVLETNEMMMMDFIIIIVECGEVFKLMMT